jgi:hypothetical protein
MLNIYNNIPLTIYRAPFPVLLYYSNPVIAEYLITVLIFITQSSNCGSITHCLAYQSHPTFVMFYRAPLPTRFYMAGLPLSDCLNK